jgi:hypothetical protein
MNPVQNAIIAFRLFSRWHPAGNAKPRHDTPHSGHQSRSSEYRSAHSTLNSSGGKGCANPQKSAILGPSRGSRDAQEALQSCGAQQRCLLERAYISHLASRPIDLLAIRGRV